MTPTPKQLLVAANAVLSNDEPVLQGRRSITAAALTRHAIEDSLDSWLTAKGVVGRSNRKQAFLCLTALHPEPDLARELHYAWERLSDACHATSYELPPIPGELQRWIAVADKFVSAADQSAPRPRPTTP